MRKTAEILGDIRIKHSSEFRLKAEGPCGRVVVSDSLELELELNPKCRKIPADEYPQAKIVKVRSLSGNNTDNKLLSCLHTELRQWEKTGGALPDLQCHLPDENPQHSQKQFPVGVIV